MAVLGTIGGSYGAGHLYDTYGGYIGSFGVIFDTMVYKGNETIVWVENQAVDTYTFLSSRVYEYYDKMSVFISPKYELGDQ